MKRKFSVIDFSIIAGLFNILFVGCSSTKPSIGVTPDKAEDLIKTNIGNSHFIIVDVRTPEEFSSEHFTNAINIDFKSNDFSRKVDELNKEETYLVYCRSGKRSAKAADIMKEKGFKFVYDLEGGLIRWHTENRSLEIK